MKPTEIETISRNILISVFCMGMLLGSTLTIIFHALKKSQKDKMEFDKYE